MPPESSHRAEADCENLRSLRRSLAKVGIVALVEEATGYQEFRAVTSAAHLGDTTSRRSYGLGRRCSPTSFFAQVYRLQGWEYKPGTARRTQYVGKLINKYIYEQLPPGVLQELQELNSVVDGRRRPAPSAFRAETGNTHLGPRQISTVTTLLRIAKDKPELRVCSSALSRQRSPGSLSAGDLRE